MNLSDNIPYRTQRDNKYIPYSSCNSTSVAIALEVSGITTCDPDTLYEILTSKESIAYMQKHFPDAYRQGYMPYHLFDMQAWAVNEIVVKRKVCEVRYNQTAITIANHIRDRKGAVTVSTVFTSFGHVVCVVGYEDSEEGSITSLIIDDPYGNPFTGYKDRNGNDITIDIPTFNKKVKQINTVTKKYGLFFLP